jgi:hypothetical protein
MATAIFILVSLLNFLHIYRQFGEQSTNRVTAVTDGNCLRSVALCERSTGS